MAISAEDKKRTKLRAKPTLGKPSGVIRNKLSPCFRLPSQANLTVTGSYLNKTPNGNRAEWCLSDYKHMD